MIFGKHINRYYLRFLPLILLGLAALVLVDYLQMVIPGLYQMVINGINTGFVEGVPFDMAFLVDKICMPMLCSGQARNGQYGCQTGFCKQCHPVPYL